MSFLVFISQQHKRRINQKKQEISFLRKEEDSAMTQSISSFPKDEERHLCLPLFKEVFL